MFCYNMTTFTLRPLKWYTEQEKQLFISSVNSPYRDLKNMTLGADFVRQTERFTMQLEQNKNV